MKQTTLCTIFLVTLSTALAVHVPVLDAITTAGTVGEAPEFCHDLDCPKYELEDTADNWEKREYEKVCPKCR